VQVGDAQVVVVIDVSVVTVVFAVRVKVWRIEMLVYSPLGKFF
jgi:hypothetical protein